MYSALVQKSNLNLESISFATVEMNKFKYCFLEGGHSNCDLSDQIDIKMKYFMKAQHFRQVKVKKSNFKQIL